MSFLQQLLCPEIGVIKHALWEKLSKRERDVMLLLSKDLSTDEVAQYLDMSRSYSARVLNRLEDLGLVHETKRSGEAYYSRVVEFSE